MKNKTEVKKIPLITPEVMSDVIKSIVANAARDRQQKQGK